MVNANITLLYLSESEKRAGINDSYSSNKFPLFLKHRLLIITAEESDFSIHEGNERVKYSHFRTKFQFVRNAHHHRIFIRNRIRPLREHTFCVIMTLQKRKYVRLREEGFCEEVAIWMLWRSLPS